MVATGSGVEAGSKEIGSAKKIAHEAVLVVAGAFCENGDEAAKAPEHSHVEKTTTRRRESHMRLNFVTPYPP